MQLKPWIPAPWAAILVLLWWLWPGDVQAAYGSVTLDLRPETGDVPTHLCVVSEANSPRTRRTLWEILAKQPISGGRLGECAAQRVGLVVVDDVVVAAARHAVSRWKG